MHTQPIFTSILVHIIRTANRNNVTRINVTTSLYACPAQQSKYIAKQHGYSLSRETDNEEKNVSVEIITEDSMSFTSSGI